MGRKAKDLTGQRFGRLTAVRKTDGRIRKSVVWECSCSCGKVVHVAASCLVPFHTKSCGCLKRPDPNAISVIGADALVHIEDADGSFVDIVVIDCSDVDLVSEFKWHKHCGYAYHRSKVKGKRFGIAMHRLVMGLESKDPRQVDHINGDRLDNRRKNLRIVSANENRKHVTVVRAKSGYKGVYPAGGASTWCATIKSGGVKYYLGTFRSKIDAAKAYNKKAIELVGDLAHLNVIED